jgi:hypothetical protein
MGLAPFVATVLLVSIVPIPRAGQEIDKGKLVSKSRSVTESLPIRGNKFLQSRISQQERQVR